VSGSTLTGSSGTRPALERRLGLMQATATNLIGMVGVGPFLTIPVMIAAIGGPHIIYPWIAGAVLALADGLVYAQLGAALPGSGGPYLYLREAYKPFGIGRLMSFVFTFQVMIVAPLSIASGAVGFANYLGYYWHAMTPAANHLVAAAVCVVVTALLYRRIEEVGRLSVWMLGVVVLTVGWVLVAGAFTFSAAQAFDFPPQAFVFDRRFVAALGAGTIVAIYNYGGYNNVCNIGEEIRTPEKTIPRAIVLSIVCVVLLYVAMSTVMLGMVPWQEAERTTTIASIFIGRTFTNPAAGRIAGGVMTALIRVVTASSLYALLLGYSRSPFAAARDGEFFAALARVHPAKHIPHVSLLTIGAMALPFCFFSLGQLVDWLILVQILLQFVWQCAAVILLSRYRPDVPQPFRMWLYPAPALLSLALWVAIFFTGSRAGMIFSVGVFAAAVASYFAFVRRAQA
jgi:amino acid transporter